MNCIGDTMISVLASSAIVYVFKSWSDQTKAVKLVYAAYWACSIEEKEQRLVDLESG